MLGMAKRTAPYCAAQTRTLQILKNAEMLVFTFLRRAECVSMGEARVSVYASGEEDGT